jgi:hypothetical protein
LLEDGEGGLLGFVGGVAVVAEDAPDEAAEVGADGLFDGPIDGDVAADGGDEFLGDGTKLLVAENLDGAIVDTALGGGHARGEVRAVGSGIAQVA